MRVGVICDVQESVARVIHTPNKTAFIHINHNHQNIEKINQNPHLIHILWWQSIFWLPFSSQIRVVLAGFVLLGSLLLLLFFVRSRYIPYCVLLHKQYSSKTYSYVIPIFSFLFLHINENTNTLLLLLVGNAIFERFNDTGYRIVIYHNNRLTVFNPKCTSFNKVGSYLHF